MFVVISYSEFHLFDDSVFEWMSVFGLFLESGGKVALSEAPGVNEVVDGSALILANGIERISRFDYVVLDVFHFRKPSCAIRFVILPFILYKFKRMLVNIAKPSGVLSNDFHYVILSVWGTFTPV